MAFSAASHAAGEFGFTLGCFPFIFFKVINDIYGWSRTFAGLNQVLGVDGA